MPRTVHTPARNTRDSWAEVLPCMRYPANAGHRLLVHEYCGTVSRYFVAILSPSNKVNIYRQLLNVCMKILTLTRLSYSPVLWAVFIQEVNHEQVTVSND